MATVKRKYVVQYVVQKKADVSFIFFFIFLICHYKLLDALCHCISNIHMI